MALTLKNILELLKSAAKAWVNDKAPRLGAALSYYTVFAIPPLFIIVIFTASLLFDPARVRSELFNQVGGVIGEESAKAIESAMAAQSHNHKGILAGAGAMVMLILTSTGLFIELQSSLNLIWGVEGNPGQGIVRYVRNRLLSFAMVLGIGFLLLVALIVSTVLAALGKFVSHSAPGLDIFWMTVNATMSFLIITILFAMILKVLPDVKIAWRDVWLGAVVTAFLFTIGKFLLGLYLARSSIVSAYGAAGSLVLILLWVYYSAQILFFGAELTKVYANRFGARLEPAWNAH